MTPTKAAEILRRTLTEKDIASRVGCNQSTIHRIVAEQRDPHWTLGQAILRLYRQRRKAK